MSCWEGMAPGYSRAVEASAERVRRAEKVLQETLRREYPEGARVRVVHHRGEFYGRVSGWDYYGARVSVVNDHSGKESKWWAAYVEVDDPAAAQPVGSDNG